MRVKNYVWYKVKSIGYRIERYIYKFDIEKNGKDVIISFRKDKHNNITLNWGVLSKDYWNRYDRISIQEGFPENTNKKLIYEIIIKKLFEIGIQE